jgi:hypothetical protein
MNYCFYRTTGKHIILILSIPIFKWIQSQVLICGVKFGQRLWIFWHYGVDFTKLSAPSKKFPMHSAGQKSCRSISATLKLLNFDKQLCWILPNLFAICQICAQFVKRLLPIHAFHLLYAKKPRKYVDEIDPRW